MRPGAHELTTVEEAVEAALLRVGRRLVVATPIGIGKPNQLLNAFYRRAATDPSIDLVIFTALSLERPRARSALEARLLDPIVARVFGDYVELDYLTALRANRLPPNVRVHEFYFRAGSMKGVTRAQRDYVSSNYTLALRDMIDRGANVLAQLVTRVGEGDGRRVSLSSNADLSLDMLDHLDALRAAGRPAMAIGQLHAGLPPMLNRALVAPDRFDVLVDNRAYETALFAPPNEAVSVTDHAIGLHASSLVRDGGTLQIGIGSLGDAIAHACLLRQRDNAAYRAAIEALGCNGELLACCGGLAPFVAGLYGCSEMFVNGFLHLMEAGVVRRAVYEDIALQRRADAGLPVDGATGICMHGGFFLGPRDFYRRLRELPREQRLRIGMDSVRRINRIDDPELRALQRRDARFMNSAMMVTLGGAVVSDALEDGTVVSGVGGQYNFVAQAQELPGARAVICIRATRGEGRSLQSNIVPRYAHHTIPRHLRDIVVTEYGAADLRGRSDEEVAHALLSIADSRFQPVLLAAARAAGKVAVDYRIPDRHRANLPERIADALATAGAAHFPAFPFGSDFTDDEIALMDALRAVEALRGRPLAMVRELLRGAGGDDAATASRLRRIGLDAPRGVRDRLLRRLLQARFSSR